MKISYPIKGIGIVPGIYITQQFGEHLHDYSKFGMIGHNGIDIAAPLGTQVVASHDGWLETHPIDPDGYGIYARVKWDEDEVKYDTVYGHFLKHNGDDRLVKAGEVIGYVDSTGFSTGHHLHFGIRKLLNGKVVDYDNGYLGYFNPQPFFRKETNKVIYKQVGYATLYFSVGNILIPFATDYTSYLKEFADAVVVELPTSEFVKFKVASELKVKK